MQQFVECIRSFRSPDFGPATGFAVVLDRTYETEYRLYEYGGHIPLLRGRYPYERFDRIDQALAGFCEAVERLGSKSTDGAP